MTRQEKHPHRGGFLTSAGRVKRKARITAMAEFGTMRVKGGLAEMLKGGVIMDVTTAEQANIAEDAGACAVMALERTPADIAHHIDKWQFTVPFVCGCTNLGEALRRISEGAAMIRTKGEAGTGDIVNAVTHMRAVFGGIRRLGSLREDELYAEAKHLQAPVELVQWVAEHSRLPVVTFTAGGIATPADAALCMQLGADGVFVGSGIFKSADPSTRAKAIVEATTHFQDAEILARVSGGLGDPMSGLAAAALAPEELLETRGW